MSPPVTLFQDLRHAIDAAKARGIHAEALGDRRASVGCPSCGPAQQILLEVDRDYVVGMCERCGALPTDLAEEFAKQPNLVEVEQGAHDLRPIGSLLAGVHTRSTHDRITRPLPPRRWIWPGYLLEQQLGLFHGDGGLYKTAFASALAAEHTRPDGGWLLGRPVAPGRCVYLDAENDNPDIDDRLRRLGVQPDNDRLSYKTVDTGLLGQAQRAGLSRR